MSPKGSGRPERSAQDPTTDATERALRQLAVDELRRRVGATDRRSSSLAITHGPLTGERIALDRDRLGAGRDPDNEIFLDDVTVSRHHAEFQRVGATHVVVDLGSVNGTYLNGARIEQAALHDEDVLQIGRFRLMFFDGDTTAGDAGGE